MRNSITKRRKPTKRQLNEWGWGWFFVAPTVIGLIILNIIPIFQTLYLSFFKSGDFGSGNIFVGLDNYMKMFQDGQVWHAVKNTLMYTVLVVPIAIAISLVIAVFLNEKILGRTIYRMIYFIPMVAAPAAVTMVWKWMYNNHFGLINYLLGKIGISSIDWINEDRKSTRLNSSHVASSYAVFCLDK